MPPRLEKLALGLQNATVMKSVYDSARLKDVVSSAAQVYGWNQPAAVNVNIANIPMPTAAERAEMRALDRKLDAFTAMLADRRLVAGAG